MPKIDRGIRHPRPTPRVAPPCYVPGNEGAR
jgi:hypothetical protein